MPDVERNRIEDHALRLGISTCLLGKRVRYDGGHKLDRFLVNTLGLYVGGAQLMEGLGVMGTRGKHVNVLQHLRSTAPLAVMGYLKNHLSSDDKQGLLGLIEDYRQSLLPPIVPFTLLKHHLNRHPVPDWVHQQVYLNPYPKELMLRNHV